MAEREHRRVRDLAREYVQKGFDVIVDPHDADLPTVLRGTSPDLIARSDSEKFVFIVRSRTSVKGDATLAEVAQRLEGQDAWQLIVVFTNPAVVRTTLSRKDVEARLDEVETLIGNSHAHAALLYAWGALEAALRLRLDQLELAEEPPATPIGFLQACRRLEVITTEQHTFLQEAMSFRNRIAHGERIDTDVSSTARALLRTTREIVLALRIRPR